MKPRTKGRFKKRIFSYIYEIKDPKLLTQRIVDDLEVYIYDLEDELRKQNRANIMYKKKLEKCERIMEERKNFIKKLTITNME